MVRPAGSERRISRGCILLRRLRLDGWVFGGRSMARKKQQSNPIGWIMLALVAFGIYQFGTLKDGDAARTGQTAAKPVPSVSVGHTVPLSQPRFVNVASLNVRHSPGTSGELIMALPRGTALKVLDRQDGWLLVDLSPTLEGWVTEHLTTTEAPQQRFVPPAQLTGSR
jgi:hypothetical protein